MVPIGIQKLAPTGVTLHEFVITLMGYTGEPRIKAKIFFNCRLLYTYLLPLELMGAEKKEALDLLSVAI